MVTFSLVQSPCDAPLGYHTHPALLSMYSLTHGLPAVLLPPICLTHMLNSLLGCDVGYTPSIPLAQGTSVAAPSLSMLSHNLEYLTSFAAKLLLHLERFAFEYRPPPYP